MDCIDIKILDILQNEGRVTMKELGQRVGLTSPATIERVKKLEESGIIDGYKAVLNTKLAGLPLRVFILLTLGDNNADRFSELVNHHPSIINCHRVAANVSHLLEAVLPDTQGLEKLLDELAVLGKTEPLVVLSSPLKRKSVSLL
ncbi:MAG: AsnC/Lrp family transcriptional regulator [Firmicutes bacterium]|nr:AsnC/Lrp family transcriptional regulator [Bacillota bacterium]